jgi:type IX secretion system PorP/SprF family membrane protein
MQRGVAILTRFVIILLSLTGSVTCMLAQQKTQFTQYMFNGAVINPAYAGADEALSLTFIQRNQWSGIDNAPTTQTFSAHSLVRNKHLGLGLTVVNDEIGVHRNLSALTQYAYHVRTGKESYLSLGLQAGIYNLKSDYASVMRSNVNDPQLYNPVRSQTFFDFGAGVYFRSRRFHAGFSAPELVPQHFAINDTLSVQLSKVNFFLFSRYRLAISEYIDIEPGGMLKYLSGLPVSFDVNINMIYREVLTLGLSFRKSDAVAFLMKTQLSRQLQVGYSYDHPFGDVSRVSNGSHELMVNFVFHNLRKNLTGPR